MPSPRHPSAPQEGTYRIRFLSGLTVSLLSVLALFHVPVDVPAPRVGWHATDASPRIALQDVREANEEQGPEADATAGRVARAAQDAPVPTRHARPELVAPGQAPAPPEKTSALREAASSGTGDRQRLRPLSMAQLTLQNQPHIKGGLGALYLNIDYPRAAREQGVEGRLLVTFTVHPSGTATDIDVIRPLHPLCDSAAVQALRTVRFAPGQKNGTPVPVRMTLPIRFRLLQPKAPATASSGGTSS